MGERDVLVWAPGRVNLIGDHTDYTGGLALPMAIGLGVELSGEAGGSWVMLGSRSHEGLAEIPLTVDQPEQVEPPWARYVAAVVAELKPRDGLIGSVDSNLPDGRGLASSAALEVAVAVGLGGNIADPLALAELCQRAEHRAVGVPCGIMDQLTVAAATEGAAMRLDCRSLEFQPVALPDDVEIAVADSGEWRELARTPYASRRQECTKAEDLIGPLRDATPRDAEGIEDPMLARRARHVITENQRVDAYIAALADHDLRNAGELMASSHASLRDDFEASTPILDELVQELRGTAGVYGARLTGAGFGGCAVALCDPYAVFDVPILWRGRPVAGVAER